MQRKKKEKYIDKKEMFKELCLCQDRGLMSDKLGKMFMVLATRYATKPQFSGYSYKDEMINHGILSCCAAFMKFKRDKTENPFWYFTMVIHRAFLQILNKEKRNQIIRDELLIENDMDPSIGYYERNKHPSGMSEEVLEEESTSETE